MRHNSLDVPFNSTLRKGCYARKVKLFRVGLWLLTLSIPLGGYHGSRIWVGAPVMIAGMALLVLGVLSDWRKQVAQLSAFHRFIFNLLIIWGIVTILRGMSDFQWRSIRDLWGIRLYGWAWLIPLLMLLSMDLVVLRQLIREIIYQGCLGVLLFTFHASLAVSFTRTYTLTWGCSAALLFWLYLPKWSRWFVLAGAFVEMFVAFICSSRNEILGHGMLLIAASFIVMRRRHSDLVISRLGLLVIYVCALGIFYYAATSDQLPGAGDTINTRIQILKNELSGKRLFASRIGGSSDLYTEFFDDMSVKDLLIGRGAISSYQVSVVRGAIGTYQSSVKQRPNVECGYLQVLLKGGAIMLILMLSLAIPAIWLGLFRSRSWLVRGFAFVVVAWLVEMVAFAQPGAYARYLLFWMAIGACLNTQLRMLTDRELKNAFFGWSSDAAHLGSVQQRWQRYRNFNGNVALTGYSRGRRPTYPERYRPPSI
jgi:hypothetical protein